MTQSHYEIEFTLKRIDTTSPGELPLTEEQMRYATAYGDIKMREYYGLLRQADKVETVVVATATLNADKVEHLAEKVGGILESYQDQPNVKPKFLIGVFDDRDRLRVPTSMLATTESEFFDGDTDENPHAMGDDGSHEAPGLEPVGYMSGAAREDDELANATDLPTTRKRPAGAAKKAAAEPAPKRRPGRPAGSGTRTR